ncbi:hypothetical protein H9635_18330 [Solibacillus sp. A46]|uniref:Uncharacterized protein n=1 Tax=Solibacillus faecavium TaxID=2762221 RepID=A0ABR8Y3B0_9BACL|nr:hypothetical protein [Solibacillus faecavium]MBD8038705.1 hypothetical protein [Solibacillus faecavium]
MADKTFGVKVSEEMYEKAKMVIESSGVSSKDWFEKAVALYELNTIKQGSSDYTQDLSELEHHTTRMYELIVNMIQRSVYLKDHAVKDISDKLESKEAIIQEFQQQLFQLKEEITLKNNMVTALQEQEKELKEKLKANETTLENNQALIAEYKEKNDTLSGLVAKYQAYAEENEQLKIDFSNEKAALVEQANAAEVKGNALQQELAESRKTLASEQKKFEDTLQLSIERKDLEREKALVELERQQQAQLAKANEQYNEQIQALYAEIAELRKINDESREKYQAEIEALKVQKEK